MKKNILFLSFFSLFCGLIACNSTVSNETTNKNSNITKNTTPKSGQAIYKAYCLACHGKNGNAKLAGAKDLTVSTLSEAETKAIIAEGSKNKKMMAYGKILKPTDLDAVTLSLIHI